MPDTQVILGGIVFQDFKIPERINFGGAQRLVVHKLVGGNRTVDALGSDLTTSPGRAASGDDPPLMRHSQSTGCANLVSQLC